MAAAVARCCLRLFGHPEGVLDVVESTWPGVSRLLGHRFLWTARRTRCATLTATGFVVALSLQDRQSRNVGRGSGMRSATGHTDPARDTASHHRPTGLAEPGSEWAMMISVVGIPDSMCKGLFDGREPGGGLRSCGWPPGPELRPAAALQHQPKGAGEQALARPGQATCGSSSDDRRTSMMWLMAGTRAATSHSRCTSGRAWRHPDG